MPLGRGGHAAPAGPGSEARSGSCPAFTDAWQAEPSHLGLLPVFTWGVLFRGVRAPCLPIPSRPGWRLAVCTYLSCAGRASKRLQPWLARSLPDRSEDGVLTG